MASTDIHNAYPDTPPPLPRRRTSSFSSTNGVEPYHLSPEEPSPVPEDPPPPPLPMREQAPALTTPPMKPAESSNQRSAGPSIAAVNGAFPERQPILRLESTSSISAKTGHGLLSPAPSAKSREELSFQFDRHVQEIRRRRTVVPKSTPPDRDEFTRVETESGKRVLDVPLYVQAYLTYYVESLARDDRSSKIEPLKWSRMKGLLSRLYDTSSPAQSLGFYVERVMYWKNPPETFMWFTVYWTLWLYKLWLPGFLSLFVIKILNNRFGFLGNFKEKLNVPGSLSDNVKHKENGKKTKIHSQLRELIHSKDLTDWISQMMKIWGPYCQALLEENICYLERLKNLFRWQNPQQTWRIIALLSFYIFMSTFFQYTVVPAIGFFIGVEYFILLPLQRYYPRFSHVFSPVEWILWNVPTNAEIALDMLSTPQVEGPASHEVSSAVEEVIQSEEAGHHDAALSPTSLSPASKIKYEYQKRTRGRSSSNASAKTESLNEEAQDKNGKPGRLVITDEAVLFQSAKLLGRDIGVKISWGDIDTIKKSRTMNLGVWSMPGIDVTDIHGQVVVFQNVVHRDDAFRKLVMTSGKKWSPVA